MKQKNHHHHCCTLPCSYNQTIISLRNPSAGEEGSSLQTLAHPFIRFYIIVEEGFSDGARSIRSLFDLCLSLCLFFFLLILLSRMLKFFFTGNGGLGTSVGGGGAVCASNAGTFVPVARSQQGGGVRKHAHQWRLHYCSRRYLLRRPHHLPNRHRRSRLRRLGCVAGHLDII
ncbi:unnamed protein product [Lactuca saligna]|uniref:Uncharacterized protein n=1 Tax=Lactuca saligna TaxID=75948 RepID=A0AA35Z1K2_LACSI|nr:unnamed protein product [Lactuca saligna]